MGRKSKGVKDRYPHLNAEFQTIAKRDQKAFLSDQCKEIEENNRMGKTSDLFKKIRDTKGTFHAKMGSIKDRNSRDLTEAEDTKRWQEYTELSKKDLHDPGNHDGVVTHPEPDILECEVKRALGSTACMYTQSPSRVQLCDSMHCSPPGSSIHGVFPARILEWIAISSSNGSSHPRD